MNKNNKFDERQLWIRGNIFKHMYLATAVLLILNAFLMSHDIIWADGFHSSIIILLAVTAIGSIEAIVREAFFEKSRQPVIAVILVISSTLAFIGSIRHLINGDKIISNGALNDNGGFLVMAILEFIIGLGVIIKLLHDKFRKNREE